MANIQFPVYILEGDCFQVKVDLTIYAKEAVTATCYKYTDRCYVHQEINDGLLVVTFQVKDNQPLSEETAKQFCNDLIDQQLRVDTSKQFGHIRDLIVEEAFKPVNK